MKWTTRTGSRNRWRPLPARLDSACRSHGIPNWTATEVLQLFRNRADLRYSGGIHEQLPLKQHPESCVRPLLDLGRAAVRLDEMARVLTVPGSSFAPRRPARASWRLGNQGEPFQWHQHIYRLWRSDRYDRTLTYCQAQIGPGALLAAGQMLAALGRLSLAGRVVREATRQATALAGAAPCAEPLLAPG